MEYNSESNGKRKAQGDLTHDNLKSKKKSVVACVEVLSKEYFQAWMTELEEGIKKGFTKLSSELFDVKARLRVLDVNIETLQKATNMKKVKSLNITNKTTIKDLNAIFDTVNSTDTDSSVKILTVTPAKESNERKIKKVDMTEKMGRNKKAAKPNTYDPFAKANESNAEWLQSWMKIDRVITVNLGTINADKQFFAELLEPQFWLSEDHIDVGMSLMRKNLAKVSCPFRSQRLAFLDVPFTKLISESYQKFSENPRNFNWSSEFIDYFNGVLPTCERTNKRLGVDVDDAYVVLNIKKVHWIALAISFLHQHIEVYDSIISLSIDDEITEFVKPYAQMLPYLIKSLASPPDQYALSVDEYTVTRCFRIPQNKRTGDCGVYAMKYIECLALDIDMSGGRLCDENIEDIRKKFATDMFGEAKHTL